MTSDATSVHVVKLGGSLLDWPDTPIRLESLLGPSFPGRPLLIVGGGPTADIVRDWHQAHSLTQATAHDLAVSSMTFNSRLLNSVLPNTVLVSSRDEASNAWSQQRWPILDCSEFLPPEEATQPLELPHTWAATSDAIAAWVTIAWPASRLLLLKSTELPSDDAPSRLQATRLIDQHLAGWLDRLEAVDWINLRAERPEPKRLRRSSDPPTR